MHTLPNILSLSRLRVNTTPGGQTKCIAAYTLKMMATPVVPACTEMATGAENRIVSTQSRYKRIRGYTPLKRVLLLVIITQVATLQGVSADR